MTKPIRSCIQHLLRYTLYLVLIWPLLHWTGDVGSWASYRNRQPVSQFWHIHCSECHLAYLKQTPRFYLNPYLHSQEFGIKTMADKSNLSMYHWKLASQSNHMIMFSLSNSGQVGKIAWSDVLNRKPPLSLSCTYESKLRLNCGIPWQ